MAETIRLRKVHKTEAEWRELLTPEQFHVMREGGTERAFTGALVNNHDDGIYHCGACNAPLFTSDKKFDSGSGWPSFWNPVSADAIEASRGQFARDEAGRGEVRDVRGSPGACVSGWAEAHRDCGTASTALRWDLRSSNR